MKRIVVPLDASPVAESVLPVVADLARAGGGSIRLLRVEPVPNNCVDAKAETPVLLYRPSRADLA